MRPDLLTIQLGEQNATDREAHHGLLRQGEGPRLQRGPALRCRRSWRTRAVWKNLKNNYTTILQQTRIMASQRPQLVDGGGQLSESVSAGRSTSSTRSRCCACRSSIRSPTCAVRWAQLPPALLDPRPGLPEAEPDLEGRDGALPGGSERQPLGLRRHRTPKFKGHCMTMKVTDQDRWSSTREDEREPSTTTTRPK